MSLLGRREARTKEVISGSHGGPACHCVHAGCRLERKALASPRPASYAGSIRVSIHLRKKRFSKKKMDHHRFKPGEVQPGDDASQRVKPGDDTSGERQALRNIRRGLQPFSQSE
jgi:hypothetical protein